MKRKGMSKVLAFTISMALVMSNVNVKAKTITNEGATSSDVSAATVEQIRNELKAQSKKVQNSDLDPESSVRVIVELEGDAAIRNAEKPSTYALQTVKEEVKSVEEQAKELEGAEIRNTYGVTIKGFSMDVKAKELDKLKKIDGVKEVRRVNVYYQDMASAKELTQAYSEWKNYGYKGEGTLVSIIDTGIDYTHKDMRVPADSSKFKLTKTKVNELKSKGILRASAGTIGHYTDKVPFGFNYADKNDEVIDKTSSQHGMHVAGIVAANGDESQVATGDAIQGVAPQAQLLAMKVFSNGPESAGAYADDIVAAIEDSVTLGADVINMSLGSSAAFQTPDDVEQVAIKKATDAGVIVVVSAGNSSYATKPFTDPNIKDIATSGSPALAEDALMVANFENTKITANAATVTSDGQAPFKIPFSTHQVEFDKNIQYDKLADGGTGDPAELKNASGKIAFIQRGGKVPNFVDKIKNAQAAGAIGVIIYNHAAGGNGMINMATDPSITIPAAFTTNSAGTAIVNAVNGGKATKLKFYDGTTTLPNPDSGNYDESTSWGPAPNLDFKPQIGAPGGDIYSTINNDKYTTMSGTSMAAPHASGGMAIIRESIKDKLQNRELVEYAKNDAMNTSQVKLDKNGIPFSPRRQGSGLIQIENAVKNRVIATYKGEANVALKEIKDGKVPFQIDLRNYGDKAVTYDLSLVKGVLTDNIEKMAANVMPGDKVIDQALANVTFDNNTVTVPANGTAKIIATLAVDKANLKDGRFLEGFINLAAKDNNPSLVVPFMGYYGDWSKEKIINEFRWEETTSVLSVGADCKSALAYPVKDKDGKIDYNLAGFTGQDSEGNPVIATEKIAISPNGDSQADSLIPYFYFLRNARNVTVNVQDKDGKDLGEVAAESYVRKQLYENSNGSGKSPLLRKTMAWDGNLYSNKSGKMEVAPDGQYYVVYSPVVDLQGATPQQYKIPVKVDTKAPTISVKSSNYSNKTNYTLQWTSEDELVGVRNEIVLLNGKVLDLKDVKQPNGSPVKSLDITLPADQTSEIFIGSADYAENLAVQAIKVAQFDQAKPAVITFDGDPGNRDLTEANFKDGKMNITGSVSGVLSEFTIGGKTVQVNPDYTFNFVLDQTTLKQGTNYLPVVAKNLDGSYAQVVGAKGEYISQYSMKVGYDSEAPIIDLASPIVEKGIIKTNTNTITLKGSVADSGFGYKFTINGKTILDRSMEAQYGLELSKRDFNQTLTVEEGQKINLTAVDPAGHKTEMVLTVNVDKDAPVIKIDGVENGKTYDKAVKISVSTNETAAMTYTLNGQPFDISKEIATNGDYTFVAKAVDNAGNASEQSVTFKVALANNATTGNNTGNNNTTTGTNNTTTGTKLPQTGAPIGTEGVVALGMLITVAGAAVAGDRKRKNIK